MGVLGYLTVKSLRVIEEEQELKDKSGLVYSEFDLKMDRNFIIKVNIMSLAIGIYSAMIGVGSGMLLNPYMIYFGVLP